MARTWVVVADSAVARVFIEPGNGEPMRELEAFAHPEARLSVRELTSDLPGRAFDSVGGGRHGMQSKVGPKEQEAIAFARLVAERIEKARTGREFDRLVVAAAPAFLGRLRSAMNDETRKLIEGELDLELTRLAPAEIRKRLPESFFPEAVR